MDTQTSDSTSLENKDENVADTDKQIDQSTEVIKDLPETANQAEKCELESLTPVEATNCQNIEENTNQNSKIPSQAEEKSEIADLKASETTPAIEIISNVLIQSEAVPEQSMDTDSIKTPQIVEKNQSEASNFMEPVPEIPQITQTQSMEDDSYTQNILKSLNTGGLGLLSAYDSGDDSDASDTESVIEVPTSNYRNQVIEINSDDSSSSSSSSDEEECDLQKKRNELEKMIQVDDSDEEEEGFKRQPPKVQGELIFPPIEDLHITVPEQECEELGTVNSIIDQLLLVKTIPGTPLLDIGTVLFLEKGQKVLGEIFDVLGQVADPLYCIRFNNNQHIKEKAINIGDKVYCAPRTEHTQLIILSNLTKMKGSDASWENDVEPPAKYVEYSDDEEEQAARRARRTKARNEYRPDDGEVVDLTKRPRQQNPNRQPRSQGSQQYYQQMHQQQPFNYQSEGNTWHSNFQPQYMMNPYAMPPGNFSHMPGGFQNQNNYNQGFSGNANPRNFNRNRNYQPRGNYPQNQGNYPQNQGNYSQQQGNPQFYQGQPPFYQQGGNGGYQ
uniref:H/ACA ribonucleoprotein complex non-core subunit NAF1 n=1 Tax=Megaselia scalaris TaxID=36166 RepID=T1GKB5_MEGSC